MTRKPRFVADTNILISSLLLFNSLPGQAVHQALSIGVLLRSEATLFELARVLERSKFDDYATLEERKTFLDWLIRETDNVEIEKSVVACRDPKDDKFLELAVNGGAACVISGDNDLLVLDPFQGIPILSPARFIARY